MRMDYQSLPHNESILTSKDPIQKMIGGHKRINSASLDYYNSNTESAFPKIKSPARQKNQALKGSKEESMKEADEIRLFSRKKKKRSDDWLIYLLTHLLLN